MTIEASGAAFASGTAFCVLDRGNKTVVDRPPLFVPEPWTEDAECSRTGLDPNDWHADPRSVEGLRALAVCGGCPVRFVCAQKAKERGEQFGIWGRDFNDPTLTRCPAGHWITDTNTTRDGSCKPCRAQATAARRAARKVAA